MRKIADIQICPACLIVVHGTPSMGDGRTQTECTRAAAGLAKNWPGYHVHSAGPETCDGSFSREDCDGCDDPKPGTRFPAVVLAPDI